MHDQRSVDGPSADGPSAAAAVLDVLLEHHPGLLALDELVGIYAGLALKRSAARMLVEDGVAELLGGGLAHRLEGFVFASRAAVHARELIR